VIRRFILTAAVAALVVACGGDGPSGPAPIDRELRDALATAGVAPLDPLPPQPPALVSLGRVLMFDKILSGNRDISCATCHNPLAGTTDGLSLSIGTGGAGAGAARQLAAAGQFTARSSQELFNRGYPAFRSMFWDGRVRQRSDGTFETPAGDQLPGGLSGPLAAQAMFPVVTRVEMRGRPGENELAALDDSDHAGVWAGLMARLLAIPEYVELFEAAFPGTPAEALGFQHAANAIAAFEAEAFTATDSPFDRYLRGDAAALSDAEKRGARLFFGEARCSQCHQGPHLSDQQFHAIAVPQLGPGFGAEAPEDFGRSRVTGAAAERYQFRTPALRNVELTGPWMHDGAYTTLEAAVRHYVDVRQALESYDGAGLRADLRGTVLTDPSALASIESSLDPRVREPLDLGEEQLGELAAFLRSLTDPSAGGLGAVVPERVPSGLPVGD
jgi:cytochrome c peroxidase